MNTLILIIGISIAAVFVWAFYFFIKAVKELGQMEKAIMDSQEKLKKEETK